MGRRITGTIYKRDSQGRRIPRAAWAGVPGIYWLRYMVNGKSHDASLQTDNLKDAERERRRRMAPFALGDKAEALRAVVHSLQDVEQAATAVAEATRPRLAVGEAWAAFAADRTRSQCGAVTLKDYQDRWAHFVTWWAEKDSPPALEAVTKADAVEFAATLNRLSPNRQNKIIQTCRRLYALLLGEPTPFDRLAKLRAVSESHRPLTREELVAVTSTATGELRVLLLLGLYTALRLGDCCLLTWGEVDLQAGRLCRRPRKTRHTSGAVVLIPLHPALQEALAGLPGAHTGPVLPDLAAKYQRDPSAVTKLVTKHFRACGIETQTAPADGRQRRAAVATFHSLRHSFVSLAGESGAPLPVVQELAGHGSPAIQRVYLRMGEDATRAAIAALPDVRAGNGPKTGPQARGDALAALARIRARVDAEPRETRLGKDLRAILDEAEGRGREAPGG